MASTATPNASTEKPSLQDLMQTTGERLVTITMPTHRSGREVQGDAIQFKNMTREALDQLAEHGLHGEEAQRYLEPFLSLPNNELFWQQRSHGLIALLSDDGPVYIDLDESPQPSVSVGSQFDVQAWALQQANDQTRWVLAVSKRRAEVFEYRGGELRRHEADDFPATYDDLITDRDPEEQLQYHSQGTGGVAGKGGKAPIYHGQGHGEEKREADQENFYARVLDRFQDVIKERETSVVLMATEEVAGHILAKAEFSPAATVSGSIDGMQTQEILDRIKQEIESIPQPTPSWERFGTAQASGQGSDDIDEIAEAAKQGRVDTLILFRPATLLRDSNDADARFEPLDSAKTASIVRDVSLAGGSLEVTREPMPESVGNRPIAAIYRY